LFDFEPKLICGYYDNLYLHKDNLKMATRKVTKKDLIKRCKALGAPITGSKKKLEGIIKKYENMSAGQRKYARATKKELQRALGAVNIAWDRAETKKQLLQRVMTFFGSDLGRSELALCAISELRARCKQRNLRFRGSFQAVLNRLLLSDQCMGEPEGWQHLPGHQYRLGDYGIDEGLVDVSSPAVKKFDAFYNVESLERGVCAHKLKRWYDSQKYYADNIHEGFPQRDIMIKWLTLRNGERGVANIIVKYVREMRVVVKNMRLKARLFRYYKVHGHTEAQTWSVIMARYQKLDCSDFLLQYHQHIDWFTFSQANHGVLRRPYEIFREVKDHVKWDIWVRANSSPKMIYHYRDLIQDHLQFVPWVELSGERLSNAFCEEFHDYIHWETVFSGSNPLEQLDADFFERFPHKRELAEQHIEDLSRQIELRQTFVEYTN
jgi:hypothetical protein